MNPCDCYGTLGVSRDATPQQIKTAYRRLAHELHPDKNPGDRRAEEMFKEVVGAYQVLSDPDRRRRYDLFGLAAEGNPFGGARAPSIGDLLAEFARELLGRRRHPPRGRGADLRYSLSITLGEAAGAEKRIVVPKLLRCTACDGRGAAREEDLEVCTRCGGQGEVGIRKGWLALDRPCPRCGGRGRLVRRPCARCGGVGSVRGEQDLLVKVPPGVREATRLKIAGEGEAGFNGGEAGDLFVIVSIAPHPFFSRENADLLCRLPLTFVQAALGDRVEVPTLDGRVAVSIPPGTQSGQRFRLRGKGMPRVGGRGCGDQIVEVEVEVPERLTDEQRELLKTFASSEVEGAFPRKQGFDRNLRGDSRPGIGRRRAAGAGDDGDT